MTAVWLQSWEAKLGTTIEMKAVLRGAMSPASCQAMTSMVSGPSCLLMTAVWLQSCEAELRTMFETKVVLRQSVPLADHQARTVLFEGPSILKVKVKSAHPADWSSSCEAELRRMFETKMVLRGPPSF